MIVRITKYFFLLFGGISFVLFALCFTTAPFWMWYKLSTKKAGIHRPPDYIIVLGGGGMPSETGLMRTWYAARLANRFENSSVIIALPGKTGDSLSSVNLMKEELVLRGIAPERILLEDSGKNTRAQSLLIFRMIMNDDTGRKNSLLSKYPPGLMKSLRTQTGPYRNTFHSLVIVTSPEHLDRAVLAFRKAGFYFVDGLPAFDVAIESDITFLDYRLGGRPWLPEIGNNLTARYTFWTQMHYEQLLMREYAALIYYWGKGWI
jgi:uncharacterized SAM-binding protein YcdF (DUF218 family)